MRISNLYLENNVIMISSDNSELNDIVDVILINKKYNKTYNSKITIETGKLYIEILPTIFEQNEVSDWKMLYKKKMKLLIIHLS